MKTMQWEKQTNPPTHPTPPQPSHPWRRWLLYAVARQGSGRRLTAPWL
jgi:hypothetical protein